MIPILEIKDISKKYLIRHEQQSYLSLRDSLSSIFSTVKKNTKEDFWALKDITLNIYPGESIGIIGKNGAGKSTLLKILSKITPPTSGKITARGRIASLLEVGTGFHPELTGKENIFLNGSILGMRKKEIENKFDEIIDFSGVEKFLDTPLKHYSSGMQLRLAFAVAAFLEPEILVIDEVLAVGDSEFQKKCIGKMNEVSKSGRTILFVSHNMAAIETLCSKSILLKNGEKTAEGPTPSIINQYNHDLNTSINNQIISNGYFNLNKDSTKKTGMTSATLFSNNHKSNILYTGCNFKFEVEFTDNKKSNELVFGFVIKNSSHQSIFGINNLQRGVKLYTSPVDSGKIIVEFDDFPIYGEGTYFVDLYLGNGIENYDIIYNAFNFQLKETDAFNSGKMLNPSYNLFYYKGIQIFSE